MEEYKYIYKLVLNNGKEYIIRDKVNNVNDFIESSMAMENNIRDYLLVQNYTDGNYEFNTVMIKGEDIVAVEYLTEWK